MTKNQLKNIIERNQVLPDELDKDKYFGFFPAISLTLAFGIPLLPFLIDKTSINPLIKWIGFISGLTLILITYFSFKNEKNINSISTNLDKESNLKIIEQYFKKQNISLTKHSNYSTAYLPTIFYKKGLKLLIIHLDNKILFNIRTIGLSIRGGRIPYSIGKNIQKDKLIQNLKTMHNNI